MMITMLTSGCRDWFNKILFCLSLTDFATSVFLCPGQKTCIPGIEQNRTGHYGLWGSQDRDYDHQNVNDYKIHYSSIVATVKRLNIHQP